MDRISINKHILVSLLDLASNDNLISQGYKLYLSTSNGLIEGIPLLDEPDENLEPIVELISKSVDKFREENNLEDTLLPNDEGFIILKDVIIHDGSKTFNMPFIIVFIDKITGVSIGQEKN